MRNRLKEVIRSGQLEIVNGGMSMPDEACTNYEDLIDNFVLGHQFVYDKFGVTPLIGYQIDSFGHSSVLAELMIEMGYKGLVLTRIHYHDKETRKKDKSLEFM